jgi:hypothetical protein
VTLRRLQDELKTRESELKQAKAAQQESDRDFRVLSIQLCTSKAELERSTKKWQEMEQSMQSLTEVDSKIKSTAKLINESRKLGYRINDSKSTLHRGLAANVLFDVETSELMLTMEKLCEMIAQEYGRVYGGQFDMHVKKALEYFVLERNKCCHVPGHFSTCGHEAIEVRSKYILELLEDICNGRPPHVDLSARISDYNRFGHSIKD